ncbi:MAG: amino acid ABC transporter permease [Christensenellaceae bacterium]|nr:amino acid ABC transporter permease [Christensenellaceae bacterium]
MQWSFILTVIPTILKGIKVTLLISVLGIALGFVLGFLTGVARTGKNRILNRIAGIYVGIIRGTPLMVQALYIYFAIPTIFQFDLSTVAAGVIAIGLNSGAYISEVVRGAIQSIDPGQKEAGICLGLSKWQVATSIVYIQALKIMLPGLGNQFIISVKDTSLLTAIGVAEMTHQASRAVTTTFRTVETYTALAVVYLVLCSGMSYLLKKMERRMK